MRIPTLMLPSTGSVDSVGSEDDVSGNGVLLQTDRRPGEDIVAHSQAWTGHKQGPAVVGAAPVPHISGSRLMVESPGGQAAGADSSGNVLATGNHKQAMPQSFEVARALDKSPKLPSRPDGSHPALHAGYSDDSDFDSDADSQPAVSPADTVSLSALPAARGRVPREGGQQRPQSGSSCTSLGRQPAPSSSRLTPGRRPDRGSSCLGCMPGQTAADPRGAGSSRPCSATRGAHSCQQQQRQQQLQQKPWQHHPPGHQQPPRQASRPCSPSHAVGEAHTQEAVEARVARQMQTDPAAWTVREVGDWLEVLGLGQYRRKFVHNAISGALLLRMDHNTLKVEVGIGPLGHREGLLTAIHDLEKFWQQQRQHAQQAGQAAALSPAATSAFGSPGSSRPSSPPVRPDYSLQRAYAQRARLMRELEKAESRQAHRRVAAEQAMRVVEQASDEVRRLQATIHELDRVIGWGPAAADQRTQALDIHGMPAWHPAGRQRSPQRPASEGGPRGRSYSPGSHMSAVSRRIMEAREGGSGGKGRAFLDRLAADLAARQAKAARAAKQAGRYRGTADEVLDARERGGRDLLFLRDLTAPSNQELAQALASEDAAQLAEACDQAADCLAQDWGLPEDLVAAVKQLGSPPRKAARLAGALRSAQFMRRLRMDLQTREQRLNELQQKYFKLEGGNSEAQQDAADLAAAQQHFGSLGWPRADLAAIGPGVEASPCDGLLAALLKRVAALQVSQAEEQADVDWQLPEWQQDGLDDLQAQLYVPPQADQSQQGAAADAAAQQQDGSNSHQQVTVPDVVVPEGGDHLLETVEQLTACHPLEIALLEGLRGYRKLMMTWRAVRAQQFVAFTRQDMELRRQRAAQLEQQVYPDTTKVLSREDYEAFFDRLMADTARRAQHRDELAEQVKADALAKLKRTAPAPLTQHRQQQQEGDDE